MPYQCNPKAQLNERIQEEEKNFLQWSMSHEETSEFFITQTFIGGVQPKKEKPVREYMLTFLLNLTNNVSRLPWVPRRGQSPINPIYAIGGSWDANQDNQNLQPWENRRQSHFHLMVSVPLILPSSVVMRLGSKGKDGRKLPRWGKHTCDVYDPDRGGFPYMLTRHIWEKFQVFHPRK